MQHYYVQSSNKLNAANKTAVNKNEEMRDKYIEGKRISVASAICADIARTRKGLNIQGEST